MNFKKLLKPESVAVIGASADTAKVGNSVLENMVSGGYAGKIYPVNPKADEIRGMKCYPSILAVKGSVDLAVIAVKREIVASVLKDCVTKGVEAAVIITAGFAETGEEGKRLQNEVAQIARQSRIALLGPNSLGLINPWQRLNASFGQAAGEPGSIALISQSGALITAIQDMAAHNKVGFSLLASIGNKATLDEVEFLQMLQRDENTTVITAYLEDISRGQEFMRIAERISKSKPIVVLKAGRTAGGAKAASSHTGSLAGSDSAYASAFERTGVIRVDSIERLLDIAVAFACQPLPKGDRIAVVTNAGGPGIMMTDALEMNGLSIAQFDDETRKVLLSILPAAGSCRNPVDVLGDAGGALYGAAVRTLLESKSVDGVIVILTPQKMTDATGSAAAIAEAARGSGKPVLACFMGADSIAGGVAILRQRRIPCYPVPERAAQAIHELVEYGRYRERPLRVIERFAVNKIPVMKVFKSTASRGVHEIGENDAKTVLEAYNFNVPPGALAVSVDEAVRYAHEFGYPVAMKISSPDILHKSDIGGVKVGLANAQAVEDSYELMMLRIKRKMPDAVLRGVLIEKMILGGKETILGMKKDPQFGPVLMFGLGGIFVEVLKDVSFGLAPVTAEECMKMLEGTRSYRLLTGARGEKPVDISAIVLNMQRLSQLVLDFPEISEIDINPLKVGYEGDGAFVIDARIILAKNI
ncbi:MAG: acetate--CoA ligase family protein [Chitinispirillaceae bacterium]|nr:acetate--CoA ligase family protein [Chitinispirillaceae bacterium]